MDSPASQSVDAYIRAQPPAAQAALRRVRAALRRALPGAREVISYGIPAYQLPGGARLYFAGWKEHFSLYPASDAMLAAFRVELTPRRVSKGTLRFSLSEPVPARLIKRVARWWARQAVRPAGVKKAARQ
jgi:uncharacterized protein YdhG (YjbR/CyaY superfamily)